MSERCIVKFDNAPPKPQTGIRVRYPDGKEWTLGQVLQKYRVLSGQSQREVAAVLIKDPRWVNDVEHDRLVPAPDEFLTLAAQVGMSSGVYSAFAVAVRMEHASKEANQ